MFRNVSHRQRTGGGVNVRSYLGGSCTLGQIRLTFENDESFEKFQDSSFPLDLYSLQKDIESRKGTLSINIWALKIKTQFPSIYKHFSSRT